MRASIFASVLIASTFAGNAWAEEADRRLLGDHLTMPEQQAASASLPGRGMGMKRVGDVWGQPERKVGAVGTPPISRWIYQDFTVYFEHQHVIHSVPHEGAHKS